MKFLLPLALIFILFAGCNKIEGQLNITKEMKLINSKGVIQFLKIGTYNADLNANTSRKITLRLNNDSTLKFAFNYDGNIPDNGAFTISSKVSGQPVEISGDVSTDIKNSEIKELSQICTYQAQVEICRPLPNGRESCTIENRTVSGIEWITYYDSFVLKNVNLSVKSLTSLDESADFHGNISYTNRVILSQTVCR